MQLSFDARDDAEPGLFGPPQHQQVDRATLRILAEWIARRDGLDPEIGANVDRGFVLAQARA